MRCIDRLIQCDEDLAQLVTFLHEQDQSGRLRHYTGHDVDHILHLLHDDRPRLPVTSSAHLRKSRDPEIVPVTPSSEYDVIVERETPPRKRNLDAFRRAARGLHYVSIAILSFLLLEVEIFITRIRSMERGICPTAAVCTVVEILSLK